ncbi:TetR/AcrR family transcriptional regulator [Pararhodonellum marinum]|uniref:TetR/AcrR family transcriptional regulator n=1 Tax=Pararhodonellum marinum TaxID=2755358 RepID=UPI00188E159A|nr:TetR/AcrR family transcriptional regulator [Pararhodonellum marinum]
MSTKEKIIEVAVEQFMRYGVRAVTMDDIARMAGISKKTIYQEFEDKNQLVNEVFANEMEKDECQLKALFEEEDGIINHFFAMTKYLRKRFAQMNPMLLHEIQRYYPQCWQRIEDFKTNHMINDIMMVLNKGKEDGLFRPEIDTRILAQMRLQQITMSMDSRVFPPGEYNMMEVQLQIFNHFLHGILTDKGRKAYDKKLINQEL